MEGIKKLLTASTAGLPNWAWILVIGGGIAAAIFVPKLFGGGKSDTSGTDTTGTDGGTPADLSSLSPTVPSVGGYSGPDTSSGYGVTPPPVPTTTADAGAQAAASSASGQLATQAALNPWIPATLPSAGEAWYTPYQQAGAPFGTQPTAAGKYITVGLWPSKQMGWAALASKYHISVKRLEQLNPTIPGLSQGGHGSAHPGETIRIA